MYVVTGGAGFIGSAIVSRLNQRGIDDILIVDELGNSAKWHNLVKLRFTDYLHKDVFLAKLRAGQINSEVRAILHMGACSSTTEDNLDFLLENNYRYSVEVAEFALRTNARLVYASSAATYGDGAFGYDDEAALCAKLRPLNRYGYSKLLFDLWVLRNKLETRAAGLRFFNVFGPNEYHKGEMRSVVHKSFGQIKAQGEVRLFRSHRPDYADGEQKRDFVYIKDCLDVVDFLLDNPRVNGIFNLGTGQARSWNDLAKAVFSALGLPPKITYFDMPAEIRDQYQYFSQAKMERLRAAGYVRPFMSLEDSVRDYVQKHLATGDVYL